MQILRDYDTVMLIDTESGIAEEMKTAHALELAVSRGLNLVMVGAGVKPACKIVKYEKYLYSIKKKKAPKAQKLSCIMFGMGTDVNDFNVKVRKVLSLLEGGEKVSVVLRSKGRREAAYVSTVGIEVMNKVVEALDGKAKVDQKPQIDGRTVRAMFIPLSSSKKRKSDETSDAGSSLKKASAEGSIEEGGDIG